ncbi:hypothetical protein NP233_g6146 [Leucocoprinus birnbaumii]|uniref:Uncharacterized protein n=1 Tax=Leucocoprinus birnbaumii TaxID=56174 RepID=A0AAD5YVT9_9AGAR|nr:hypothetical protein NP233_g6146 [Leucocoprinus birnbaumii]
MVLLCSDHKYWAYGDIQPPDSFDSFTFTYLIPVFSIVLHSLWRPFTWHSYTLIAIDYLYSMLEITLLIIYIAHFGGMPAVPSVWYRSTLYPISAFTLLITYFLYLCVLSWEIISGFLLLNRRQDEEFSLSWGGWISLFLGRQPWRQRYLTEGRTARWIRGSAAICCLCIVVLLAFTSVIVRVITPSQSTLFISYWGPVLELRSLAWLEPTLVLPAAYSEFPLVNQVMNVIISDQVMLDIECMHQVYSDLSVINVTVVICRMTAPEAVVFKDNHFMAEFLYTINFSSIPSTPTISNRVAFYLRDPMADVRHLVDTTDPTMLRPGNQLQGTVRPERITALLDQQAAAFSINKYFDFWPVNILSVIADPISPSLDRTQASLRLTIPPITRRAIIREDVPSYTILEGLSFVGGAWTALNGTFVAVFGSTVLLVLFGIKPLSVYGLVHLLYKERPVLKLGDKDLTKEEIYQVIRTLREHLLDAENDDENRLLKGRERDGVTSTDERLRSPGEQNAEPRRMVEGSSSLVQAQNLQRALNV